MVCILYFVQTHRECFNDMLMLSDGETDWYREEFSDLIFPGLFGLQIDFQYSMKIVFLMPMRTTLPLSQG